MNQSHDQDLKQARVRQRQRETGSETFSLLQFIRFGIPAVSHSYIAVKDPGCIKLFYQSCARDIIPPWNQNEFAKQQHLVASQAKNVGVLPKWRKDR